MYDVTDLKKDDFFETKLYEYIFSIQSDFERGQEIERFSLIAQDFKIRNFKKMCKDYEKEISKGGAIYNLNSTNFTGQPIELNTGEWICNDFGITRTFQNEGTILACSHPIMPTEILTNIDTGIEKIKLSFKRKTWKSIIVEKEKISSSNKIVELSNAGIAVNSNNAKILISYLHDIETLNYELLPEKNCVSRLGWIDSNQFAPYVEDLVFDGDMAFKSYFESVRECGNYDKWLKIAKDIRSNGTMASRIILAGSFASALVKPLGVLPFFIHLWGGTENGKTVALMFACSVWANPEMGEYIHTFNSTAVGQEKSAAFVNSLPLIMDELQIIRGSKDFDKIIYMLAEGVGRTRGNKQGGIDRVPKWSNLILTSGEMPITNTKSGAGAVNRILEIECKKSIFKNAPKVANTVKANYGYAGKKFIEIIRNENMLNAVKEVYKVNYDELSKSDTTEKQAMAMALVLTADMMATQYIFEDSRCMTIDDVKDYMQSKSAVDINLRAYDFIIDWVSQHHYKFAKYAYSFTEGEAYGLIEDEVVYINASIFNSVCEENNFNPTAFKSWLFQSDLIICDEGRTTKNKKINGITARCVALKVQSDAKVTDAT